MKNWVGQCRGGGGGGGGGLHKTGGLEPSANYVPLGASYYVCELSLQNMCYIETSVLKSVI